MKLRMSFLFSAALLVAVAALSPGCGSTEYAKLAPRVIPGQSILGQNTPFLGKPVEILKDGTNLVVNFIHANLRRTSLGMAVDVSSLSIRCDEDGRVERVLPSEGSFHYHGTRSNCETWNHLPGDLLQNLQPGRTSLAEASKLIGQPFRIGLTHGPDRRVAEWFFWKRPWNKMGLEQRLVVMEINSSDAIQSIDIHELESVQRPAELGLIPPRPADCMLIDSHPDNR